MFTCFKKFFNETDGAITVDFVLLSATIIILGLAIMLSVSGSTTDLASDINLTLDNKDF